MIYDHELPEIAEEAERRGYNRAIDECLRKLNFYRDEWDGIYHAIEEIEQLKATVKSEETMKTFDLSISTHGYVNVWSDGLHEYICSLSFVKYDENDYTKFQIGENVYRVNTKDYESHNEIYDRFLNRCRRLKKGE